MEFMLKASNAASNTKVFEIPSYFGLTETGGVNVYGFISPVLFGTFSYLDYRYFRNSALADVY